MEQSSSSRHTLTDEQLSSYRRYGFAFPLDAMSDDRAAHYCDECNALEQLLGGRPRTVEVRQMHLHFPWAHRLCTEPAVLNAVEDVLGPNIVVWATELFAKAEEDPNLWIGWHRDRTYTGFAATEATTAWIALAPSVEANGCMQVIAEPDRATSQLDVPQARRGGRLPTGTRPKPDVPDDDIVNVELKAGQMSLHDGDVYHGSGANVSRIKRVGFAIRYVRGDAKPIQFRPTAVVARGRASSETFDIVPAPTVTDVEPALAAMKRSATAHLDAMLENVKKLGA
ncbi:MAG: hypothetical protein B7733_07450 [Myxococcales bacterium FL481]|nr:MAG: hypothetical protein B7733_07450 [Myxococcales bacterium FL481]